MLPAVLCDIIFEYIDATYDMHLIDMKILKLEQQKHALVAKRKAEQIYDLIKHDTECFILCDNYTDDLCKLIKGKYTTCTQICYGMSVNDELYYEKFKNINVPDKFNKYHRFSDFAYEYFNKYHLVKHEHIWGGWRVVIMLKYLHIIL